MTGETLEVLSGKRKPKMAAMVAMAAIAAIAASICIQMSRKTMYIGRIGQKWLPADVIL